jgi:hypothetical protein
MSPTLTGVPAAFLPSRNWARAAVLVPGLVVAAALADPVALELVAGELAVLELALLELAPLLVLELLLQAAAAASVAVVMRTSETGRNARLAPLPCLVEIISYLAGGPGDPAARGGHGEYCPPFRQII